ncbi:hypothetical protein ACSQ6I_16670 [Anabaena sp. WFMT]
MPNGTLREQHPLITFFLISGLWETDDSGMSFRLGEVNAAPNTSF